MPGATAQAVPAEFASRLAQAVMWHRAGRISEAKAEYTALLAIAPEHGWTNYFRGMLAEAEGEMALARRFLRTAAKSPGAPPQFLVGLGNLELAGGDAHDAAAAFEAAITARPDFAAAHTGHCLALKRLDRLESAVAASRDALALRRGWRPGMVDPPGFVDPGERAVMRQANRVKLRHDLEQLSYLRETGIVSAEIDEILCGFEALRARYAALCDETVLIPLSNDDLALTGYAYNRLLHLTDAPADKQRALGPNALFAAADAAFAMNHPPVAVVDDALSPSALCRLQELLTASTIWFEVKDHGGHVGTYFEEGLGCGLTVQIANELRLSLRHALAGRRLTQLWAYKYQQGLAGTDLHADVGEVSVNLWVTPDSANLDPEGGGMEIYPLAAPENWDFGQINVDREQMRRLVAARQCQPARIPYRCNRMVIFAARLLHRTMAGTFSERYQDRRINMTFLFA